MESNHVRFLFLIGALRVLFFTAKWNFQEQTGNNRNKQEQTGKTRKVVFKLFLLLSQGSKVEGKLDLGGTDRVGGLSSPCLFLPVTFTENS